MKNIYSAVIVFLMLGVLHNNVSAQLSVVNEGATYIVDFSTTIPGVNNGVWAGKNISSSPLSGELDRNGWFISNGLAGGSVATFGGSSIPGGGSSNGTNGTGLIYAYQTGFGDPALGVSPASPSFTPGIITLKVVNNTGQVLKAFDVSFTDLARNSGNGMMSLNFWYSSSNGGGSYTHLTDLDFLSPGVSDNLWYSANQSATITGLNIPNGGSFYLQWEVNMSDPTGPDELAIDNISITGYSLPTVTSIPSTVCAGSTINIAGTNFIGTDAVSVNGVNAPEFDIFDQDSISVTIPFGSTTGVITVSGPGGSGTSSTSIIVNPVPNNNTGVNRTICSGSGIIIGGANQTGHTYNWSPATGLSSTKVSNPTAAPTASTTYTLAETIVSTGCSSINSVVVRVNPVPTDNAGADVVFCNGSGAVIGKGAASGHTYSWSPSSGLTGSTISNPTASPSVSTTYTLTETITSTTCFATNTVIVTVNPLPNDITPTGPSAVCSGSSANISIAGSQVGVNYQLRNNAGNVNVGSAVAGTGGTINLSTGALTSAATYNVLATYATTLCNIQMTGTVSIAVNLIPVATATNSSQLICSGSSFTTMALNTSNTVAGTTFAWTRDNISTVTGIAGSGSGSAITGVSLNNITGAPVTVTFTITPTGPAPTFCAGNPITATLTINAMPTGTASPQSICSGAATNIALSSTATGTTFSWTAVTISGTINGASNCASACGTTIIQTLTSTSGGVERYSITPIANSCIGTTFTSDVTVNPLPTDIAPSGATVICSGTSANISIAGSQTGVNYQLRNNAGNANVGSPVAGTGGSINLSSGVLNSTATFNVLATNANSLCSVQMTGTVTITVNPTPLATASNNSQTICGGASFNTITFGTSNGVTGTTFGWTRDNTSTVTGIAASGSGSSITGVALTNSTPSPVTVTFTITPTGPAPTFCAGIPITATVTINPVPTGSASPQSLCSGAVSNIILNSNTTGTSFTWVASTFSGSVSGGANCAGTCGSVIAQTLTSTVGGVERYSVTPSANSCSGSVFTVDVTVNALPSNITPTGPAIVCSGSSAVISIPGSQVGINYQLRNNAGNVNVGSPVAGTGGAINLPTGNLTNTTTYNVLATNGTTSCSVQMTGTVTITVVSAPGNNAGTNKTICKGATTTVGTTGTVGHTYNWAPATGLSSATTSNPTANPTITTTYTLTETITLTGCTATNSVTLTVNSLPADNAGANRAICKGAPTTLGAGNITGETYSWLPSTGLSSATISNPSASPTNTITYTLTETSSATGCSASNNVVVTVNPLPANNTGGNKSVCSGGSVVIGAANTVGNFYSWTPATGLSSATISNPTASPTATTVYSLKETSATGCSVSNIIIVSVNPSPADNAGTDKAICNGANTTIGAAPAIGHIYNWSPSIGLSSSTVSNPGANPIVTTTYTLTEVLTSSGCSAANSVVVTVNALPANNAGTNQSVCSGSGVVIGNTNTPEDTYSWSPATGLSNATISNPIASPASTTTYTLTETVGVSGCSTSNSMVVTVNPIPGNNAGTDVSMCGGSAVAIGVAPTVGNTYSWSPASGLSSSTVSNPTASPTIATTYTLTEATSLNCSATNTVVVSVSAMPNDITPGGATTICAGTSTNISITNSQVGVNYQLRNNAGNVNVGSPVAGTGGVINLSSGILNVTTTFNVTASVAATSCNLQMTGTVTITVTPAPIATATSGNQSVCSGTSFTPMALSTSNGITGTTFAWTRDDVANVTGIAASGSGTSISGAALTNTTSSPSKVTFTIIPTGPAPATCVGSSITATVTVNPIPSATANPLAICSGTTSNVALTSTVSNTSFNWIAATTLGTVSGASNCTSGCGSKIAQTLTTTTGGIEKYTIIPIANSCIGSTFTVNVTVNPVPVITGGTVTICQGSSTTLNASGATSYSWSPATGLSATTGASVTANPASTITYTITGKNNAGCSISVNSAVIVNQPPVATAGTNQTTTQITANWTASAGATGYFLDVSTANDFSTYVFGFQNLNVGTVTSYNVSGLTPSTTYYYRVRAKNNICGSSINSNIISYSTACPSLAGVVTSPDSSVICNGTTEVLTLNGGAAAQSFQWQISTDNVNWNNVSSGGNTSSYSTATNDGTGKKYYRCLMTNSCYTAPSTTALVAISVVPTVKITNVTATTATVTWSPYGAGQFNISWTGAGAGSANAVTTNSYTISNLVSNQDLTVVVTPANPSCGGANAGSATTHTLCAIPTIASVTASPAPAHGFKVTWSPIVGVTAYRVYYLNTPTSSTWSFADTTGTSMTITVPNGGQTYGVYVAVKNCPSAGSIGDGSAISYVSTNPVSGCSQVPVVTAVSNCPNQITTNISGGGGSYLLTLKRVLPSPLTVTYTVSSTLVNITIGSLSTGSTWQVSAKNNCGTGGVSDNSNIATVNVKPGCPAVTNVVLSKPTCSGFTVSWNVQDCMGSGVNGYQVLIKKSGVLNYTSYPVGMVDHTVVSWLSSGATYNVAVIATSCNGTISPNSLPDTISLAACRAEDDAATTDAGVSGNSLAESVLLYPNPSGGQFSIDLGRTDMSSATVKIELLNQLGQVIQTNLGTITGGHFTQVVNAPQGIATGVYFVRTSVGEGNVHVNRLMIYKD